MNRKRSWWHHLKEKRLSEKIAAFLLCFRSNRAAKVCSPLNSLSGTTYHIIYKTAAFAYIYDMLRIFFRPVSGRKFYISICQDFVDID